ncbi:hypothetical protein [Sinorhizobium medicae]
MRIDLQIYSVGKLLRMATKRRPRDVSGISRNLTINMMVSREIANFRKIPQIQALKLSPFTRDELLKTPIRLLGQIDRDLLKSLSSRDPARLVIIQQDLQVLRSREGSFHMHRTLDNPADHYSKPELFALLKERQRRTKQRESPSRDCQHGGLPSWILATRGIDCGILYEPARQIVESDEPFDPVGVGYFSDIRAVAHRFILLRVVGVFADAGGADSATTLNAVVFTHLEYEVVQHI